MKTKLLEKLREMRKNKNEGALKSHATMKMVDEYQSTKGGK